MTEYLTLQEILENNPTSNEKRNVKNFIQPHFFRVKRFFSHQWKTPYLYALHSRQKLTRGFSDQDAWNGDQYLAGQIAGIMQWIIDESHSCSAEHITEDMNKENPDVTQMVELRNKDYTKHINVFKEYSQNGVAHDLEWQKEFGGVLEKDIQHSLQWLVTHFQGLWD